MPPVKCAVCNCWKHSKECKSLSSPTYSWFRHYLQSKGKIFNQDDLFYCKSCTNALYIIRKDLINIASPVSSESSSSDLMNVDEVDDRLTLDNILFTGSGHKKCVICRIDVSAGIVVMPQSARLDLLLMHRLYAPHGTRCCSSHLINDCRLRPNECISMKDRLKFPTILSPQEVRDLFNDIFSFFDELRSSPRLNFDDDSLTDGDYNAWTGWSKEEFNEMYNELSVYLRSSWNRTKRNALAIFWIKVKTNLSFHQIGSLFSIHGGSETRRLRTADAFDSVREVFIKYFVPKHLGIGHITIADAKSHNTAYSKVCFVLFLC